MRAAESSRVVIGQLQPPRAIPSWFLEVSLHVCRLTMTTGIAARAADPQATALKEAADGCCRDGNCTSAVPLYTQALELAGAGAEPHLRSALLANRCLALLKTGQAAAALKDAQQAVQLRPRWHKAHLRLAQCREAGGNVQGALAAYRRALELEPSLGELVGRALVALEQRASRAQCRLALRPHPAEVYGMALHPKTLVLKAVATRLAATACGDGVVRVWCASTGLLLQALPGHQDMVTEVEWSPCGGWLASGSVDGTARLWRLSPALSSSAGSNGCSAAAQPQPTAPTAAGPAAGAAPGVETAPQLLSQWGVLEGHTGRVSSLAFCQVPEPASNPAAGLSTAPASHSSSGPEGLGGGSGAGAGVAGGQNGSTAVGLLLATGSTDCTARLWSVSDRRCLQVLKGHGGIITSVSVYPCGQLVATASGDTRCKVWSMASGAELHDIAWDSGGVNLCGFLPPAQLALSTSAAPGRRSRASGRGCGARGASTAATAAWPAQLAGTVAGGTCVAGRSAAATSLLLTAHIEPRRREGRVLLWDVGAGNAPQLLSGAGTARASTALAAAPAAGATGERDPKATAKRAGWVDGRLCAPALTLDGFRGKVSGWDACLGPGGELLLAVACADGAARVYDLSTGGAKLFELSVEGSAPSAAQRMELPAWSAASMAAAANARSQVCFSPGRELLAVSGGGGRVSVYDVETSKLVQELLGHGKGVRALRWLGERELVSAGEDGAVKFWRLEAANPVG